MQTIDKIKIVLDRFTLVIPQHHHTPTLIIPQHHVSNQTQTSLVTDGYFKDANATASSWQQSTNQEHYTMQVSINARPSLPKQWN